MTNVLLGLTAYLLKGHSTTMQNVLDGIALEGYSTFMQNVLDDGGYGVKNHRGQTREKKSSLHIWNEWASSYYQKYKFHFGLKWTLSSMMQCDDKQDWISNDLS